MSVLAVAPALPLGAAGKYVAGAFIVFVAMLLIYLAIIASRAQRTERELARLRRDVEEHGRAEDDQELDKAQERVSPTGARVAAMTDPGPPQ